MRLNDIKKTGVVGRDGVSSWIAGMLADAGYPVIFCDLSLQHKGKSLSPIEARIRSDLERGIKDRSECERIMCRVVPSDCYEDLADVDVLFELFYDDIEHKKEFYAKADMICKKECIFVAHASELSIDDIALASRRSEKVLGMEFCPQKREEQPCTVFCGHNTAQESYNTLLQLLKKCSKKRRVPKR